MTFGFTTDDRLEVTNNFWEWCRTKGRSHDVVSILDTCYPSTEGSIYSVLKHARTICHAKYLGTKQFHTENVKRLTFNIFLTHIDCTVHVEKGCGCCCCNTVLTCTSFGDDFLLAHTFGKQNLTKGIVNLVGTCVVKVLTFKINLCPTNMISQTFSVVKRRLTSHIVFEEIIQFRLETWIFLGLTIGLVQFNNGCHQRFRNELTTEFSVKSFCIRLLICHAFTLSINALILSKSLEPSVSTPEDTSKA